MLADTGLVDRIVMVFDEGLRTCFGTPTATRLSPADSLPEPPIGDAERRTSIALMRVNHAGEVAAQALYVSQAVWSRSEDVREQLIHAAAEEKDHLAWCQQRLDQLGGTTSRLVPFWYAGSALIGAVASMAGDRNSLGFVQETERQVETHLDDHLQRLPKGDDKSRVILEQMADDEARHGQEAAQSGADELPSCVTRLMAIAGESIRNIAQVL